MKIPLPEVTSQTVRRRRVSISVIHRANPTMSRGIPFHDLYEGVGHRKAKDFIYSLPWPCPGCHSKISNKIPAIAGDFHHNTAREHHRRTLSKNHQDRQCVQHPMNEYRKKLKAMVQFLIQATKHSRLRPTIS